MSHPEAAPPCRRVEATAPPWGMAPDQPMQDTAEVHVWRASLDGSPDEVERLRQSLAPDELERAERLIFPDHRRRFIVARGCLRSVLARYLGSVAADIRFDYGPQGKPRLAAACAPLRPLHFNLSHSGGLALIAVTGMTEVGIDVEQIRSDCPAEQIARHFFSAAEIDSLASLAPELRSEAFFRCWTRKEAYIKAKGHGLSLPLDQFDVTLAPGEPASLLRTAWDPGEAAHWSLHTPEAGPGYAAAVALRGHGYQLHCWRYA